LRAYARLLGIDSDVLILQFNEIYTSATGLSSNHSLENSPLQQLARLQSRTRKSNGWMMWLLVPIVLVVIVLIFRPIVKRLMGSTSGTAAPSVVLAASPQAIHTPAPLAAIPPVTSTPSLSDQLILILSKPSDVNVQDATGKTLISGTQGTAQPLTLNGVSPFSVTLADAAHVSLSLNGEHVELAPYTLDGHASFRLSR
jgi:cytoskeletal protein RodZ